MYHVSVWSGPHYPLLIIKDEHRGYAALTKRFNWFESLLALCPLRSRIDRNDHYVLVHWCPTLCSQQDNQNWVCDTSSIGQGIQKIPCKSYHSIDMVMIPHSSLGWETKRPGKISCKQVGETAQNLKRITIN